MPRGIATKNRSVYVCNNTFFSAHGDAVAGQRFAGNHELVKLYPAWFTPLDGDTLPVVEAATAAPGEMRGDDE